MRETFAVRVLYRQNSSWQGTVDWVSEDVKIQQKSFRSTLELIRLMDSAVQGSGREWDTPEKT